MSEMTHHFAERDFRIAMSQFCTGVVIVTGIFEGQPQGFSAQSFVSLSLHPPLIAISPAKTSRSWPRLRAAGRFGINILGADQRALCALFASAAADRFAGLDWAASAATGSPVIKGVSSFIDCQLEHEYEAGDHSIVVGRVVDLRVFSDQCSPLLFFRGRYGSFAGLDAGGSTPPQAGPTDA